MDAESVNERGASKDIRLVSDEVAQRLKREVPVVFGVYGGAISDLWDALPRNGLKYICPMHEQSAGFMAEGYCKIAGFGVVITTSGPGALNIVTCLGNCYYDSVPVLFITGQVNTRFMRPDDSVRQIGFQETDIVSIAKPITKAAVTVKCAEDVMPTLESLIDEAKTGRPGPVLLDLPIDVQRSAL
jgi:acetolactate synthase-1/2/3 large subunit